MDSWKKSCISEGIYEDTKKAHFGKKCEKKQTGKWNGLDFRLGFLGDYMNLTTKYYPLWAFRKLNAINFAEKWVSGKLIY